MFMLKIRNMRISLINTQILEGNNIVPPLGLLYIAAVLEKNGHIIQVFDVDPEVYDLIDDIKNFKPDMIGLSFLTPAYRKALNLTKKLKEKIPNVIYVCGGVHPTIQPIETLNDFGVDFIVVGEGEDTIVELCEKLEKKESVDTVKGIIYKNNGQIINTGRRELIKNLDLLPFPARHLLNSEVYLTPPGIIRGYATERLTSIVASRGCPFNCIYCGSHNLFGRKIRRRTVDNVIAEIEHLIQNYKIKGLYFCDDLFTNDHKWVREFCQKLKEKNIKIVWACQSRVDTITEELMRELKSAGCVQIDFGVENGSDKILKVLNKATNVAAIKKAFQMAKKAKIRTCATFMIGNPSETLEDVLETFEVAKEISADYTVFYYTTPYPGTKLYEMAKKNNWISPDLYYSESWSHRQPDCPLMSINFTKEELMHIRSKLQNYFFIKNYFHWNNAKFYFELFIIMIKYPNVMFQIIKSLIKTKRSENIAEILFKQYNLDKYKWFSELPTG